MRKTFFRTFVALLLIFSLAGTTAYAESATVMGNAVNMREGPGTGYRVIDTLPAGAVVEVTDRSNASWYAVSYNGRSGYMSSGYLSLQVDSYQATVVSSPAYEPVSEGSAVIIMDGGSSYSAPSAPTTVVLDNGGTAAAETGGTVVTETGSSYPAVSDAASEGSAVIVLPSGSTLSLPASTPAPTASADTSKIGKSGTINADFVCLRSGPSSQYSIISKYNKGKELVVTGVEENGWTPCTIDNRGGYVYTKYISLKGSSASVQTQSAGSTAPSNTVYVSPAASANTAAASGNAYITGNNVRFRSGPSMSSSILGEFFYGNSVTVTGTSGDWTAVTYNGKSGYVYSSYVKSGSYTQSLPAAQAQPQTATQVSTAAPAASAGSATGQQIVNYALQFVGYRYSWGGKSPETGFDCSGFVYYVYSQFGYTLNRVACDQALNGVHVDAKDIQPGDVLCFYSNDNYYIGHTGIYIGNNKFIHASTSTTGVIISELNGYYFTRGYEARRIV